MDASGGNTLPSTEGPNPFTTVDENIIASWSSTTHHLCGHTKLTRVILVHLNRAFGRVPRHISDAAWIELLGPDGAFGD